MVAVQQIIQYKAAMQSSLPTVLAQHTFEGQYLLQHLT